MPSAIWRIGDPRIGNEEIGNRATDATDNGYLSMAYL